jgi:hypothetical protein
MVCNFSWVAPAPGGIIATEIVKEHYILYCFITFIVTFAPIEIIATEATAFEEENACHCMRRRMHAINTRTY